MAIIAKETESPSITSRQIKWAEEVRTVGYFGPSPFPYTLLIRFKRDLSEMLIPKKTLESEFNRAEYE